MRAIRRDRQAHWRAQAAGVGADAADAVAQAYETAVDRFRAVPQGTDPEAWVQDWEFVLASVLDASAALPPEARAFLAARPVPDLDKSTRRLVRRTRRDYGKSMTTGASS